MYWYKLAAAQGNDDAKKALAALQPKLLKGA
jgi:hypothetical protein